MERAAIDSISSLLASEDPAEIREGLAHARILLTDARPAERRALAEIVSGLFYLDPLDRPGFLPLLDDAIEIVASLGESALPMLLDLLDGGDMKAQIACGHALGRIGPQAITPLIAEYGTSAPTRRALILYAFGKIRSPEILKAVPLAIGAMLSPELELRDTAARALGKFAEVIPAGSLSGDLRLAVVERLMSMARDLNPSLRAKSVRALGKLAKCGHMTTIEEERMVKLCTAIVGTDGAENWDRAYIVRKEAEEALRAIRAVSASGPMPSHA